jgi:cell division protein ZapA (FtsZ GTPase activity inhibitor)
MPKRLNMQITDDVDDRLQRLRARNGSITTTEVFRRALAVYEKLLDTVEAGGEVVLKDADGRERVLVVKW